MEICKVHVVIKKNVLGKESIESVWLSPGDAVDRLVKMNAFRIETHEVKFKKIEDDDI